MSKVAANAPTNIPRELKPRLLISAVYIDVAQLPQSCSIWICTVRTYVPKQAQSTESIVQREEHSLMVMGIFKRHKDETTGTPPAPPSSYQVHPVQASIEYAAPLGPPPSHQQFGAPAGPPPNHDKYQPPPGPPPSKLDKEPPPYHDWTVVPDNALLPPPPSIGHERSCSSNANVSDADRAHEWCQTYPMIKPHQPSNAQHGAAADGDVRIMKPYEYKGDLLMPSLGLWRGSTHSGSMDSCLISSLPLYFAAVDAPTTAIKTIYYEIRVRSLGRGQGANASSIAIGYCAVPYPTWRMPGWERGSLAVHGDDGRKYVNDTWGGKDFTSPFRAGDTLGLGMSFSAPENPPDYGAPTQNSFQVKVFLTRNGEKGESWDLHEELDADNDLGIDGLDGRFDLYAAVGIYGGVEFDILFKRQDWLWRPR